MNILQVLTLYSFILVNCSHLDKSKRHIHKLVRPKHLNHSRDKDEFFLRCPKISQTSEKIRVSVAWIHDNRTVFSIINGKIGHKIENITVRRWHTLKGHTNVLANSTRLQFEYEEGRNWYALRIKRMTKEDVGFWKCRMVVWFEGKKVARRYESRKRIQPSNRPEFFTFKKRNLSDSDKDPEETGELPVTFTKPNAEFTVFSRMSKFNEVAYNRMKDKSDKPSKDIAKVKYSSISNISITYCPNFIQLLLFYGYFYVVN